MQRPDTLRSVDIEQNAPLPQKWGDLFERSAKARRIVDGTDRHRARARRDRIVESGKRRLDQFHAAMSQMRRVVVMIREFILQRDYAVPRFQSRPPKNMDRAVEAFGMKAMSDAAQ